MKFSDRVRIEMLDGQGRDAETGEELAAIIASSPVFAVANIEVQPLADVTTLEVASEALRRTAAVPA